MALLEFSVAPVGTGESMSQQVAKAVALVASSGMDYELHAMGTVVEGDLPNLLALMQRCIEALAADCNRVSCTAKIDYRPGYRGQLKSKVAHVQQQLAQP